MPFPSNVALAAEDLAFNQLQHPGAAPPFTVTEDLADQAVVSDDVLGRAECPSRCHECFTGGSYDGGVPVVNGTCTHYCSAYGYCGTTGVYKWHGQDCRGCAHRTPEPAGGNPNPDVIVEWQAGSLDYAWDSNHTKEDYTKRGLFVQHKNCLTGLKVDPSSTPTNTTLYVTVPRWRTGTASTLNVIRNVNLKEGLKNPILTPYPDWDTNALRTESGNCQGLQYVQSMEIDNNGLMWVIDCGRINVLEKDSSLVDNTCPPKILIIDTKTGEQVDQAYIFPDEVASYSKSLLNDIVVDTERNVAYISSVLDGGAIFMYNRTARKSYKFQDPTMGPDLAFNWTIGGHHYDNPAWRGIAEDGIALSPNGEWLYYSALTAPTFHRVPTATLWRRAELYDVASGDFGANHQIQGPFPKSSPSDGMTFGCDGTLFYGGLTTASVYSLDTFDLGRFGEKVLAHNDTTMQWPDTFAWGPDDALWYTSNKADRYFADGTGGPFRILRQPKSDTIRGSYTKGPCY